jgi:hypothetical protein
VPVGTCLGFGFASQTSRISWALRSGRSGSRSRASLMVAQRELLEELQSRARQLTSSSMSFTCQPLSHSQLTPVTAGAQGFPLEP